jgi:hypothetical protein
MSSPDSLKVQLRPLVARFGRTRVLQALRAVSETGVAQLEPEIADAGVKKPGKPPRQQKTVEEMVASLRLASEEAQRLMVQLGHLYESRQFLPNLHDADEFLRRNAASLRKCKSRKEALRPVLQALSGMPASELAELVDQTNHVSGQSDYAILANELMGKGE